MQTLVNKLGQGDYRCLTFLFSLQISDYYITLYIDSSTFAPFTCVHNYIVFCTISQKQWEYIWDKPRLQAGINRTLSAPFVGPDWMTLGSFPVMTFSA